MEGQQSRQPSRSYIVALSAALGFILGLWAVGVVVVMVVRP